MEKEHTHVDIHEYTQCKECMQKVCDETSKDMEHKHVLLDGMNCEECLDRVISASKDKDHATNTTTQ